jgi:hypothetical protein
MGTWNLKGRLLEVASENDDDRIKVEGINVNRYDKNRNIIDYAESIRITDLIDKALDEPIEFMMTEKEWINALIDNSTYMDENYIKLKHKPKHNYEIEIICTVRKLKE